MHLGLGNGQTEKRFRKFLTRSSTKFDGTDDQVLLPVALPSTFSVSFWFKQTDTANGEYLFDSRNSGSDAWAAWTSGTGPHTISVWNGATHAGSVQVPVGTWAHVVITVEGQYLNLYVNGEHDGAKAGYGGTTTSDIKVGTRYTGGNAWQGSMDEWAIFSSALTARQVSDLYNNGQPTKIRTNSNLSHWYRMGDGKLDGKSDGDSNLLFDQGPNGGLGSEKITNGDFSDASVPDTWNGSAGANLAGWAAYGPGHTANAHVTITNGAARIRSDGTYAAISQSVLSSGASYKYSIDVTDATSGSIQLYGGAVLLATINSTGTYSGYWTSTDSNPFYVKRSSTPTDVTFDNVSVREVQNVGTISGALIKDESTAESVPKQTQNLPSGASKKSMAFDGTDDFVDTGFQPDFIHTNATMAYWVNMDDFVSTQLCGTHNGKRFYLGVYNATAGMGVQDQNNLGSGADVSGLMAVNQWHHLAMVADGGTATFYLDGVARDTLSYTQNSANNPSANLYIGGVSNSGSAQDFMNASIDEFAVWDTALDGDAVKALYNAGLPTPVATKTGAYDIYRDNLKAHYRMGDATNPAADGTSSRVNTHLFDQTNPGLGTEPLVADPYTSQKWALGSGNTATFVAGESVRIDRPATGGDGSAGYSYITDDAEGILTEDLVATKVYKFTLLFETDDSDAVVRVYGDGGIYQSSAGSGVKTFYLFGHGGGTYMTFGNIDNGKFVKVSQLSVKPVNGNTGTISGATIQTESPKAIYALPPLSDNNRSLILDGTNDHLVTQVDKTAQPNNESRYYSFWLKSTTTSRYAVFDHGTHQIGALQFNDSNKPILYMSTSSYQMWNDNSAQDDGNWHHWVVKIKYNDITGCELWCDGVKQTKSTTVNTGSMNTYTTGLRIGISGSFYLNGSIDEFSIHEELDEEAIRALYNRGRPIDISSNHGAYDQSDELLHWWRMGDAPVGQLGSSGDVLFQGLRFEGDEMFPTNASSSDWASLNNMTWDGTTLSYAGTGGEQATAQYTFTLPVGQTFRLTVDIENDGTGNFFGRIGDGSNSLSLTNVTTGTYEVVHTVTESGANNTLFFIVNSSFSGTISNISLNRIRGQYIGPELFKADADLYQASTWTSYGDNVETFPNGTAVRFTSPASGGHVAGGTTTLRSGSGVYALTENMETGYVYKLSFDFLTDDADAFPRYYSGSGYTNISAGSGFKVLYFVPTGSGGVAINVDALSANKFVQFSNLSLTKIGGAAVLTNMDSASDIQTDTPY